MFMDLLDPLGYEVDVVLETSHNREARGHIDLYREHIDLPVLKSILWDYEDLLVNDGCTGIAVLNPAIPQEVQFDEHKLLIVYGSELAEYERIFGREACACNDQMKFITEAEHVHSSSEYYRRAVRRAEDAAWASTPATASSPPGNYPNPSKDRAPWHGLFLLALGVLVVWRSCRGPRTASLDCRTAGRRYLLLSQPLVFVTLPTPFLRETIISHGPYAQRSSCFSAPGRVVAIVVAGAGALVGCHAWHPPSYVPPEPPFIPLPPPQGNPIVVGSMDRDFVWDQVVDVVDDYFRVQHEERVRTGGRFIDRGPAGHLSPQRVDHLRALEPRLGYRLRPLGEHAAIHPSQGAGPCDSLARGLPG